MESQTTRNTPRTLKSLQGPILHSAILQGILLFIASIIMDGGGSFRTVLFAVAVHWLAFILIALRRRDQLTAVDAFLLKYGFLAALIAFLLLSGIIMGVSKVLSH